MIDIEKAKMAFADYVSGYNPNDERIALKIRHTYSVLNESEAIAKQLELEQQDIELAILIGLLHDIGRFEQVKIYHTFDDSKSIDHADFGVEILFNDNLIRKFIEDSKYDNIIKKAILAHNKYKLPDGLNDKELLHSKIIRDADKIDNFYLKLIESSETLFHCDDISNELISDKIFNDFINHKCILATERVTNMDCWVSYLAWIFDLNFDASIKIVKEKNYINQLIDRIDYKNPDTISKMNIIKKAANEFLNV